MSGNQMQRQILDGDDVYALRQGDERQTHCLEAP